MKEHKLEKFLKNKNSKIKCTVFEKFENSKIRILKFGGI
jgi:hypothetical protein